MATKSDIDLIQEMCDELKPNLDEESGQGLDTTIRCGEEYTALYVMLNVMDGLGIKVKEKFLPLIGKEATP